MTDKKIVEPTDVVFDTEAKPQADEIDGAAGNAASSLAASNGYRGSGYSAEKRQEDLDILGEKVIGLFKKTGGGVNVTDELTNIRTVDLSGLESLIALSVSLEKNQSRVAKITLNQLSPEVIKTFLENKYGEEIAHAGIYEEVGLDGNEPVNVEPLIEFFPEFSNLAKINERVTYIKQNPWQTLLALSDVRARAFLSGTLNQTKYHCDDNSAEKDFYKPLTTHDVLNYAKEVGDVPNVANYLKLYNAIGNKP